MDLPADVLDNVIKAARLQWPHEACGLLAGPRDGDGPTEYWNLQNVAEHPRYRYAMDGADQLAAWRAIENNGHRVFAIFHSHTADGAEPSPEDLRHALDPDVWHLIVSLRDAAGRSETRLWKVVDGSGLEQPYLVT